MHYIKSTLIAITFTLLPVMAQAAATWPANVTSTSNVAAGLTVYNSTGDGFEASGAAYLDDYGYIVNGDDGDLAVLSTTGAVLHYWFPTGDLEDVAITDTTANDHLVYLANEATTAIDQFNLSTGEKTGRSWTLSGLTTSASTGDGLEALVYVPAAYAPTAWGTASSNGFFLAASQAEAKIYVYNINTSSSNTVSPVTSFSVTYTNVSALHYNTTTQLLYVVFDTDDKIKEYSLTGNIINSYLLPAAGSTEGVAVIPNCSTGMAQIALTNDAVTSTVNVYDNYPVTCPVVTPTVIDNDSDGVNSSGDCNDNDASVSVNQTYYRDADGDGLGISTITSVVCSMTASSGYVTNASDINDGDYDNDGVETGVDCNDANATISANQTYYRDADGDGLGDSASTTVVCSNAVPVGYVTNATDTDDSGTESTYSQIEYSGNGIDDDGDGSIDEINTVVSNGYHPTYSAFDPSSIAAYDAAVLAVTGLRYGRIEVTYADHSVYQYTLFTNVSRKTTIISLSGIGYITVKNPKNGRTILVNVYTGIIAKHRSSSKH